MKATVVEWKDWAKNEKYPVLNIETSKDDYEGFDALNRLAEVCRGERGRGYLDQLVAINNVGHLVVDIGTLITLYSQLQKSKIDKAMAVGWLRSLVDSKKVKKEKIEIYSCRCGLTFKNEKIRKKHLKKCSVIAQDMPLLRRVQKALQSLKEKKVSNGKVKSKTRKLENPKGSKLGSKALNRQKDKKTNKRKIHKGNKT